MRWQYLSNKQFHSSAWEYSIFDKEMLCYLWPLRIEIICPVLLTWPYKNKILCYALLPSYLVCILGIRWSAGWNGKNLFLSCESRESPLVMFRFFIQAPSKVQQSVFDYSSSWSSPMLTSSSPPSSSLHRLEFFSPTWVNLFRASLDRT